MHIGQDLDLVSRYDSLRNPLTSQGDYLDPELISRYLAESGTVTLRKRRLPLEMMVWCIVGMALERKEPLHQIVNRLRHLPVHTSLVVRKNGLTFRAVHRTTRHWRD